MNFGDLVRVSGYWPRVFKIACYRMESNFTPNEQWTDMVYELTDVESGEWLEADAMDLTLVAPADKADEYLSANPPQKQTVDLSNMFVDVSKYWEDVGGNKPKEPPKPTARELSSQEAEKRKAERKAKAEQIDNLLDIANWNRKRLADTGDESYGDRLFAVEAELKKLVEDEK